MTMAVGLLGGCAASGRSTAKATAPAVAPPAAAAAPAAPAKKVCRVALRPLSAAGREGRTPDIVAAGDGYAVAWEEGGEHRGVRVATFDAGAQSLGPAIEVADLARPGAAPRLASDGDQLQVTWTAVGPAGRSTVAVRRLDRAGRPLGDPQPRAAVAGSSDESAGLCAGRRRAAGGDELVCGEDPAGQLPGAVRVAVDPRGIAGVRAVAGAAGLAVAWQSGSGIDSRVRFATVSCGASAGAATAQP